MDGLTLLETVADKKKLRVLKVFANDPDSRYYLRELAKLADVSPATTHRIVKKFENEGILKRKEQKHLVTYSLDISDKNNIVETLKDSKNALDMFVDYIKSFEGVKKVILHGEKDNEKANLLIVGEIDENEEVQKKIYEIKEKYGVNLIHLVLSPEQYQKMDNMGLYPDKKQLLYSRE